jgi:putative DNA primase/helicase
MTKQKTIHLTRASDIKPEPIAWLWKGFLAEGKLHILGGMAGTGKTTIAMDMAATVSQGDTWPDESRSRIGSVVIWSGEDSPKDTLIPRLILAGADLARIRFVSARSNNQESSFDPSTDMDLLLKEIQAIGDVALIIIDPIVSAVGGDSHKNTEVRRGLQPLVDLAEQIGAAILGITHFSKGTGGNNPLERVTGSVAFGAIARIVLVVGKSHDRDGKNIFAIAKSNISRDIGGFEYEVSEDILHNHQGIQTSRISWGAYQLKSAGQLLAELEAQTEETPAGGPSCQVWLTQLLEEENGQIDSKAAQKAGKDLEFSPRAIQRAKKALGIRHHFDGFGKDKVSYWIANGHTFVPIAPIAPVSGCGEHGVYDGK